MKIYLTHIFIIIFISIQLHAKSFRPRVKRLASRDRNRFWPYSVVLYTISSAFSSSERDMIRRAMKNIESVSCVRFKKRSYEKGYVDIIKPKTGCSAHVGYTGGRQKLNLTTSCVRSSNVVLHELLHVVGLEHEHVRPDRDDFIAVQHNNISPDALSNFNKKSWKEFTAFGLPYDYDSLMHYKDRTFAINSSKKTLRRIGSNLGIEEGVGMSKMDILKLNKMYRCQAKIPRKHTTVIKQSNSSQKCKTSRVGTKISIKCEYYYST